MIYLPCSHCSSDHIPYGSFKVASLHSHGMMELSTWAYPCSPACVLQPALGSTLPQPKCLALVRIKCEKCIQKLQRMHCIHTISCAEHTSWSFLWQQLATFPGGQAGAKTQPQLPPILSMGSTRKAPTSTASPYSRAGRATAAKVRHPWATGCQPLFCSKADAGGSRVRFMQR